MITKDNLRQTLLALDFNHKKDIDIYFKEYEAFDCEIKVDFKNENIEYPERVVVNDKTTSNFSHPENFVVLECVNRLLEKGYRPEHIELEPRWKLGRDAKGGKADICVHNKDGENLLLIIECKTAGQEQRKELNNMKVDGGQLFSYWQQERSVKWLSLYSSDYKDDEVFFENYIINCSDDEEVKKLAKKDSSIKLYEHAKSVQDLFEVWDETYDKQILSKGVIFGENSQAYQIGIPPLRKKNLVDFNPDDDRIANKFEEILRHNNVSDKENAFNRLIALFICKLVDEIKKTDEDEVEFQYKVGSDTYESLQDRLQRLHKEGMGEFMKEEIFYVPDDYAENLFATKLNSRNRREAIEDLRKTIRILKFYSNNDFAFKDVHNEQLFYQNGKILVEVVQLFEHYRIIYSNKNQFLGTLFEQLLNKGFKQNEGQFFTPLPITRFIWDSLPLKKIICQKSGFVKPKIIDYACGAGHFLTEAIEAVNDFFSVNGKSKAVVGNQWVEHCIFGVEKDYRLARVAKVSLYMNGAGNGNIKFGDGLDQYVESDIKNGTFDILVANPPFSVSAFKAHLKLKNNFFDTLQFITNEGKEIETLFVERIAQLLKPNGIAAVVLPTPLLNNCSKSAISSREILLKSFRIVAIVELGDKTFGATGMNTSILFLEKYHEPPKQMDLVKDCVDSIMNCETKNEWLDSEIYQSYLSRVQSQEEKYQSFLKETITYESMCDDSYLKQYVENEGLEKERRDYGWGKFLSKVKEIEYEKLYYFGLTYKQHVVVISAPIGTKEQKEFLGYEWKTIDGDKVIQINSHGGQLYNDGNRYDNNVIAAVIRNNFYGSHISLDKNLEKLFKWERLQDLIDFDCINFSKIIGAKPAFKFELKSKYPVCKLGGENGVCVVKIGGTPSRKNASLFKGNHPWVSIAEMNGQEIFETKEKITDEAIRTSNVKLIPKGSTLLSFKLSIGKTAKAGVDLYTNEAIAGIIPKDPNQLLDDYIFYLFNTAILNLDNIGKKAFGKSLNSTFLNDTIQIPVPDIAMQKKVIEECEKIKNEFKTIRMTPEEYKSKISNIFFKHKIIKKEA